MAEGNRFTELLSVALKDEPKTSSRKKIDFGSNLEKNPAVVKTFQKLHERFPKSSSEGTNTDSDQATPSSEMSDNQLRGQPSTLSDGCSDGLSDGISDGYSDGQTVNQSVFQPFVQTIGQSDSQTVRRSDGHPPNQTVNQTLVQTVTDPRLQLSDPVYALTQKQCMVLIYLIQQGGIAQRQAISDSTGVAFGTVKDALAILTKHGFISKPTYFAANQYRGFSYILNTQLCNDFLQKRGYEYQTVGQTVNQPVCHPVRHPVFQPVSRLDSQIPTSSSSLEPNTTTMETIFKTDPELGYWHEKGLQHQQVLKWMEETGMSQTIMVQSLKHCRFDMVDNEIEEKKPVNNVFNWFYSIIKKSGHYPKPTGYKSWSEKMMEMEKALLEEQEAEIRQMEELRTRKYKIEHERKFNEMMSDPRGEIYQMVFERLTALEKQLGEGIAFEKSMRIRFDEIFLNNNNGM